MRLARPVVAATAAALLGLPSAAAGGSERFEAVVQFGTGPGTERVMDLVLDAEGNAYVTGYTFGAFAGFENEWEADGFIAKVSPTGEVLWADQLGGDGDNGENGVSAVALDGAGGVYVTGSTQQDLHAALDGYSDPFIRKYSTDGTLVWGDQWHGSGGENWVEWGSGVAVSGSTVYVTGSTDGRGFLRTYGLGGNLLSWAQQTDVELHDVAADGADVYLAGVRFDPADQWMGRREGFVRRLAPSGTTEVPFRGESEPMRIALGPDVIGVSGSVWDEEAQSLVTVWDRSLAERWTWTGPPLPLWALAVTDAGDVFVGTADWESGDGVLRKLRSLDGSTAWEARVDGAGFGVGGVVAAGDQIVFAGASSTELAPGGAGAYVATWDTVRTVPLSRLAGADRVATAVAISEEAFPAGSDGAVLVSASAFPDAVVAAPLAAMVGGPVLLTGDGLSAPVRAELTRLLEPGSVVTIVGGPSAVPAVVEEQLRSLGFPANRLAGPTRYDTAIEVAGVLGSPPAMIADGRTYPDALVAGTAAIRSGHAVVLSDGGTLPVATRRYLLDTGPGHVAIGGPAATAAPGAETVVGSDRYDTAARVLERFFGTQHVVGLASGATFADALSLAPLLGREAAPLLLVPPEGLAAGTTSYIGLQLLEVYVAGGTDAVGPSVEQQLRALLTEPG